MHPEGLVNYLLYYNLMCSLKSTHKNENTTTLLREIKICNIFFKGTNTFRTQVNLILSKVYHIVFF